MPHPPPVSEPPGSGHQHLLVHGAGKVQHALRLAPPPIEEPLMVVMMVMVLVTMVMVAAVTAVIERRLSWGCRRTAVMMMMMTLRIGRVVGIAARQVFAAVATERGRPCGAQGSCGRRGCSISVQLTRLIGGPDCGAGHDFWCAAHSAGFAASSFCLLFRQP